MYKAQGAKTGLPCSLAETGDVGQSFTESSLDEKKTYGLPSQPENEPLWATLNYTQLHLTTLNYAKLAQCKQQVRGPRKKKGSVC